MNINTNTIGGIIAGMSLTKSARLDNIQLAPRAIRLMLAARGIKNRAVKCIKPWVTRNAKLHNPIPIARLNKMFNTDATGITSNGNTFVFTYELLARISVEAFPNVCPIQLKKLMPTKSASA